MAQNLKGNHQDRVGRHAVREEGSRSPLRRRLGTILAVAAVCAVTALALETSTAYIWKLPPGFKPPPVPADNPMTPAKVELGRYLFYDLRMSVNGEGSCGTCHIQRYGFTNQLPQSIGVTGQQHPRRVMPLANVAWFAAFTWANPNVTQLEDQALTPMFGETPVELGLHEADDKFLKVLTSDPVYLRLLPQAFPGDSGPYTFVHVRKALASFERTLVSGNSPYDRYRYGHDEDAISESAKRGEDIFFHQPYGCSHCHGGFTLGGETIYQNENGVTPSAFSNNGLYNIAGKFSFPPDNRGLYEYTHNVEDVGKFKPPSLINVAVRAPYMHDGSLRTLDDVLDHYARGGREIKTGPYAGDGSKNPNKSGFVSGFPLTAQQRADLKAFLESLTDEEFLTNPGFSNLWIAEGPANGSADAPAQGW
jgi:cytochrome c peroxidase